MSDWWMIPVAAIWFGAGWYARKAWIHYWWRHFTKIGREVKRLGY